MKEQEGMLAIGACLEELGWEVEDAATGSVRVPPEQEDRFKDDLGACVKEVNGSETFSPLSHEELAEMYELERQSVKCLQELGYQLELPTLQAYIDTYYSRPFIAQAEIGSLSPSQFDEVTSKCPLAQWRFTRDIG
ncbi:MAG: hypothetical protein IT192_07405 [Microbacteriaceae bacterium]|nr:hypothetical protein [Microbacteriaceae bacterium]